MKVHLLIATLAVAPLFADPAGARESPAGIACREGFDDVSSLTHLGWSIRNNSEPVGSGTWNQGDPDVFPAWSPPSDSYASVGADSAAGDFPVVSVWLITPPIDFDPQISARLFSFYTRAEPGHANRLVVRLCPLEGLSTCRAPGPESGDLGDFETALLDINPSLTPGGYPAEWTMYSLDGLPIDGRARIAFHYYVFTQDNSHGTTIGIDEIALAGASACPFTDVIFTSDFD